MEIKKANLIRKISLSETMKRMNLNTPFYIHQKHFKTVTVRKEASRLKKMGYLFKIDEKGTIDSCIVTRLK